MASPASNDPLPFGSAEVRFAAGISQSTLDSWLLRHLLLDGSNPGRGAERRFSLGDAVRITLIAELVGLGISVSLAVAYAGVVRDFSEHTCMLLRRREKGTGPEMRLVSFAQIEDLSGWLARGATILDLSRIAADVQRILSDPATRSRADPRIRITSGWATEPTGEKVFLAVPDPSAQEPAAEPAPVRKRATPARKKQPAGRRAFAGAE